MAKQKLSVVESSSFDLFVHQPSDVASACSGRAALSARNSTSRVLVVAPTEFRFNAETGSDNAFMHDASALTNAGDIGTSHPNAEFAELVSALVSSGVEVHEVRYRPRPEDQQTPDAVFPNNWFSTHREMPGGQLLIYPMHVPSRRRERNPQLIDYLVKAGGYAATVDLCADLEPAGEALEGTGVLVLDRVHRIAYVCLSDRATLPAARTWARRSDYELVAFASADEAGRPFYHTNVMMAIGTGWAVVCLESIVDADMRRQVKSRLEQTGHEVIEISQQQVLAFCGNVLEVSGASGSTSVMMSRQAYEAFDEQQRTCLLRHADRITPVRYDTIEHIGGGSVRCSIAELY